MSFWEDELGLELEQKRHLAILEGKDPVEACDEYAFREKQWYALCGTPLNSDILRSS